MISEKENEIYEPDIRHFTVVCQKCKMTGTVNFTEGMMTKQQFILMFGEGIDITVPVDKGLVSVEEFEWWLCWDCWNKREDTRRETVE